MIFLIPVTHASDGGHQLVLRVIAIILGERG